MEIKAVIGANYGDEGKGLVTNFLAKDAIKKHKQPIVVLNNGGPQRGHTVICGNNKHVFHHFGSGTLQNAPTFITDQYIVNPILFVKEYKELCKLGYEPIVYIDPDCYVTTPYEMLCSQFISRAIYTDQKVKDSCGLGIWESVKQIEEEQGSIRKLKWYINSQSLISGFLTTKEIDLGKLISEILTTKVDEHFANYILNSGRSKFDEAARNFIMDNNIDINGLNKHWVEDLNFMIEVSQRNEYMIYNLLNDQNVFIVENGQGLMLDKDLDKRFGTPSHTGALGVCNFVSNYFPTSNAKKQIDLELIYVSRPYSTRHGAGDFSEFVDRNLSNVLAMRESTNVPNEFQGAMRFGFLDIGGMCKRISDDFTNGMSESDLGIPYLKKYSYSTFFTHAEDCDIVFKDNFYNTIGKQYKESYIKNNHSSSIYVANGDDITKLKLE